MLSIVEANEKGTGRRIDMNNERNIIKSMAEYPLPATPDHTRRKEPSHPIDR